MLEFILSVLAVIRVFCQSRSDTVLEILALRQQVAVLKRKRAATGIELLGPNFLDGAPPLLVPLARRARYRKARNRHPLAPRWLPVVLALALPAAKWSTESYGRDPGVYPTVSGGEPGLGAPGVHGELLKLGFVVSERTVARYLRRIRRRGDPGKRWLAFLQNHRDIIVAFDFFTMPTLTFQMLYCFFVIEHGRRRIVVASYPRVLYGS